MHKNFAIAAAVFGATGVMLGAFGAHGLQKATGDTTIIHGFQTGVQYQVYHALALLILAFSFDKLAGKWATWAAGFFITGIFLFSGSLYLLTLMKIKGSSAVSAVGPVTPVGGLCFIIAWIMLVTAIVKAER